MIVKCPKCDSENVAPIYYGIQPDNNEIRELIDNNKRILLELINNPRISYDTLNV